MEYKLAIGAIFAAIIAFLGGRFAYKKENDEKTTILINSLVGELTHSLQHYHYASTELPRIDDTDESKRELKKRLLWSKFGEFKSSNYFQQYGFLTHEEIKELLQQSFLIRNTDCLIDILLETPDSITQEDLLDLKSKMDDVIYSADHLLKFIVNLNSDYKKAYKVTTD